MAKIAYLRDEDDPGKGNEREGAPRRTRRKRPEDSLSEFSNEEVTEIIRVALSGTKRGSRDKVSREELIEIGRDFGLEESDLTEALTSIIESREKVGRKSRAMQMVRLHGVAYVIAGVTLTLIYWITARATGSALEGTAWWIQAPFIVWGAFLALHYAAARFSPDLPGVALRKAVGLSKGLGDGRVTVRSRTQRPVFTIQELYGSMGQADGLAQIRGDALVLEFETKDTVLGVFKSGLKEVSTSLDEIESVELQPKMFHSLLTLQGRSMSAFDGVPGNTAGTIRLWFDKKSRSAAEALAKDLAREIDG